MFKEIDNYNPIPPNFLNSILTNPSLYKMFKDDFEENREYFQNIEKNAYLKDMLEFICNMLFSKNIFHIYGEVEDLDAITKGKLTFLKNFYDDFLLEEFKVSPESILKIRFFKGMEFARLHDEYASSTKEFNDLYDYIFNTSLDYKGIVEVLLKNPLAVLHKKEALPFKEFDILCNYVKNNTKGFVEIDIVECMLYNHAFKLNHIFDIEVAECLVISTIKSYLETYSIEVKVEFLNGLDNQDLSSNNVETMTIYFDISLIEAFCSLNYCELFSHIFEECDSLKDKVLLNRNEVNLATLRTLMNYITLKVNPLEPETLSSEYINDLKASSFIKTLRLFNTFGVNLFDSYIRAKSANLNLEYETVNYSKKEISIDQRFRISFKKLPNRSELVDHFKVLSTIYKKNGEPLSTLDMIKNLNKEHRDFYIEYLHSRVISPEEMIEDVSALENYRPKDETIKDFISSEIKYFYVDAFYYSLDSAIKLKNSFLLDEYLDDLLMKVNCIKDTPLTHKFIDEAIFTIGDAKQNL